MKFINGNNLQKYDFQIKNNHIFIGNPYYACMNILIEDNIATIMWFGHSNNCIHWKNAKHMFLWGLIVLLKNFPDIEKIILGDDTKYFLQKSIVKKYFEEAFQLNKYYFLKYGKMYYELYFDFFIEFEFERIKKIYIEALKKRNESIITKDWIINFLHEFNKKHKNSNINQILIDFTNIFGEYDKLYIYEYLSKFNNIWKEKYCNIFYTMVNLYFDEFISIHLPTSFYYNIEDKNNYIVYLKKKIIDYCYNAKI
jgi:hypothetical protein